MTDPHDSGPGATAVDDEPAAGHTITIGFWPGLLAMLALVALSGLAAWLVLRPRATPPAVAAPPTAPAPLRLAVDAGGELAPGTVLDVADPSHPLVGASAPDIAGTLLDGQGARLSDFDGRPVLVNFWATWCPPCRMEMPWLEEAARQRQAQGLVVLAVNAGERVAPEQVRGLVTDYVTGAGLTFPVLLPDDPDRSQYDYQAFSLPTSFLVDAAGKVQAVVGGAFPNRASLNAHLDTLLSARAGQ